MVLHRLGINTSGLLVFAKTSDANRGMSALFRTRNVYRQYEALVAGHVETDKGFIDLLS
jgi:23S rRNA-/tRNA-specific pseudouridylate synthase